MSVDPKQLVARIKNQIRIPALQRDSLLQLVEEAISMEEIQRLIRREPLLVARLLMLANTPLLDPHHGITTLDEAFKRIPPQLLCDQLLATCALHESTKLNNRLVSITNFWRHGIYCALAARLIAEQVQPLQAEELFVAGLLHDIGTLVLFHELPDQAREALWLAIETSDGQDIQRAERRIIGVDHAEVGAELARAWSFPPLLRECIGLHHEPQRAQGFPREVAIVHIANSVAILAELGEGESPPQTQPQAWRLLGLHPSSMKDLTRQTLTHYESESLGSFLPTS